MSWLSSAIRGAGRIVTGALGGTPKITVTVPNQPPANPWGAPGGWGGYPPPAFPAPFYQTPPPQSAAGSVSTWLPLAVVALVAVFLLKKG